MSLGFSVMLAQLSDNSESVNAYKKAIDKKIKSIELNKEDNCLYLEFEDGYKIGFFDDGQSCCETRYMTTDDDLQSCIGNNFLGAKLKEAPSIPDEYGEHEVQFLEIKTDKECLIFENHNEHNGYYGGFAIRVKEINPAP